MKEFMNPFWDGYAFGILTAFLFGAGWLVAGWLLE